MNRVQILLVSILVITHAGPRQTDPSTGLPRSPFVFFAGSARDAGDIAGGKETHSELSFDINADSCYFRFVSNSLNIRLYSSVQLLGSTKP